MRRSVSAILTLVFEGSFTATYLELELNLVYFANLMPCDFPQY